jgi:hypothetical protein
VVPKSASLVRVVSELMESSDVEQPTCCLGAVASHEKGGARRRKGGGREDGDVTRWQVVAARLSRWGDGLFRWRWLWGLVLFAALVGGKLHGSSLGAWDHLMPDVTEEYRFVEIGSWRAIRSDEWRVSTPTVFAQCAHPDYFPRINERLGSGMDMFLMVPSCPVWDWTVVGQAHNWGYFLFGAERGLAWNWWIRYLGIFLFALEFFLIWTSGARALSVVGALAICWGAPTQWWDTSVPYMVLYFFMGLVCLYRLFAERRPILQWLWGVGFLAALCSYSYSFYPPWQFLLGGLWLLLAGEMTRRAWRQGGHGRHALIVLGVMLGLWGANLLYFLNVHRETLEVLGQSVYPGHRLPTTGNVAGLWIYFWYPLVCLFTSFRGMEYLNPCLVSMYAAPLAAGVVVWAQMGWRRRGRLPWLSWGLAGYAVLLTLSVLWPWSGALARWVGAVIVGPSRVALVMGLMFLLLAFKTFAYCEQRGWRVGWPGVGVWLALSWGGQLLVFCLYPEWRGFFGGHRLLPTVAMLGLGAGVFGAMGLGLLRTHRGLFLGGYLVCGLLTGAWVHPLCVGASPLLHKQVASYAKEIQQGSGEGRWLCNEKSRAQLLVANGLSCVNGIHSIPQPALWLTIDPDRTFETAWNRYAHISVDVVAGDKSWAELEGRDQFTWKLCRADLDRLEVRYLLWAGSKLREPWAVPLGRVGANYFYRIVPDIPAIMSTEDEP